MSTDRGLCDRQKAYENVTRNQLCRGMPAVIRVDGKAFHTFTKGMSKPFDRLFISAMVTAARNTAKTMQGFKIAYIQSDEATFVLTDYDTIRTEPWFEYNINKLVSIAAATMSTYFNLQLPWCGGLAVFDARAFNVPRFDLTNHLLWRAKDWSNNSLQMYCQSIFSHKQLHRKNREALHEMLHANGKNWTTDLFTDERNGTFLLNTPDEGIKCFTDVKPVFEEINKLVESVVPYIPMDKIGKGK